jgi:hypothetical protein
MLANGVMVTTAIVFFALFANMLGGRTKRQEEYPYEPADFAPPPMPSGKSRPMQYKPPGRHAIEVGVVPVVPETRVSRNTISEPVTPEDYQEAQR